ncbi:hypothetical protein M513_00619 [Trichuris suis]|nr:hypothetical protein M513_00619 [Trichuris suis]
MEPKISAEGMFEKSVNGVHARHRLATRNQQYGESIDEFLRAFKILSTERNFKAGSTVATPGKNSSQTSSSQASICKRSVSAYSRESLRQR